MSGEMSDGEIADTMNYLGELVVERGEEIVRLQTINNELLAACEAAADTFDDFAASLTFLRHETAAAAARVAAADTRAAIAKAAP